MQASGATMVCVKKYFCRITVKCFFNENKDYINNNKLIFLGNVSKLLVGSFYFAFVHKIFRTILSWTSKEGFGRPCPYLFKFNILLGGKRGERAYLKFLKFFQKYAENKKIPIFIDQTYI
jgi:hypothetical protein